MWSIGLNDGVVILPGELDLDMAGQNGECWDLFGSLLSILSNKGNFEYVLKFQHKFLKSCYNRAHLMARTNYNCCC